MQDGDDFRRLMHDGDDYRVPELTRGLRSLGSLRGTPGDAHDLWFAPLLSARRSVEGVTDVEKQLEAMNAENLAVAMRDAISRIAVLHVREESPFRRAAEAVLEDAAADLFASLDRLDAAAKSLRESGAETRADRWRNWVVALREVYSQADRGWSMACEELVWQ